MIKLGSLAAKGSLVLAGFVVGWQGPQYSKVPPTPRELIEVATDFDIVHIDVPFLSWYGMTDYDHHRIYIVRSNHAQELRTVCHELTHAAWNMRSATEPSPDEDPDVAKMSGEWCKDILGFDQKKLDP